MDAKNVRKQIVIWLSFFGAIVLMIGMALGLNKITESRQSGGSVKRFSARSGTERKEAMAITGKGQRSGSKGGSGQSGKTSDAGGAQGEGPGGTDMPPPSPHEEAAAQALNALSPADGLAMLQDYLETLDNVAGAAQAYCAMGMLYAQLEPPDTARTEQAFTQAMELAGSSEVLHDVAHKHVSALLAQGETGAARQQAERALAEDKTLTPAGLQLQVLLGKLREDEGRSGEAEKIYRDVMGHAVELMNRDIPIGQDVFRLAGLRLSRIYRGRGDHANADAVVRQVQAQFIGQ